MGNMQLQETVSTVRRNGKNEYYGETLHAREGQKADVLQESNPPRDVRET